MRYIVIALAVTVVLLTADRAMAWNSVGHMVVAKLAYDQLDEKRQLALYKLLRTHPHYKSFLAASRPAEIEEAEWVVVRSSVWPDWIRPRKNDARGLDVNKYHRGEEHYINVPFIDPKDAEFFAGKTLVNPDLPNIVSALKQRANDLKTKTAADADRAVAACWLFHLVGDIHQPMHNVAYFSSAKSFLTGDLGGNRFAIKADGKGHRLHALWDDLLGVDVDYADDSAGHQAALYREALRIAAGLRAAKLTDAETDRLRKNVTFESWSREGFELAKTVAYQRSDGSGLLKPVPAPFNGAIPADAEEVGKQYLQAARTTAERQVLLAGRRLADRVKLLLQP